MAFLLYAIILTALYAHTMLFFPIMFQFHIA